MPSENTGKAQKTQKRETTPPTDRIGASANRKQQL
jgi:hypothetical protein